MGAIDLVVTDLDGTLWDARERIHARTLDALRRLETRNTPLLVATGRRPRSAADRLARDGFAPSAVLLDGALGKDLASGVVFHRVPFGAADAGAVLDAFEQVGLSPCVYVERPDVDVVVGDAPSTHPAHLDAVGRWLARDDLRTVVLGEAVLSFVVAGRDDPRFAAVVAAVADVATAVVTRDLTYGASALTVRPRAVSKWQGVEAYCRRAGLDPGRVLAVGDGDNDLELLTAARIACVVSDGCEAALRLADHVIEPAADGGWCAVLDLC